MGVTRPLPPGKSERRYYFLPEGGPDVVRLALAQEGWEEYIPRNDKQVSWHLKWGPRFKKSEYVAAEPHQRLSHFPQSSIITRKDKLLRQLRRYRAIYGSVYNIFPKTFLLPSEYTKFIGSYTEEQQKHGRQCIWICKPTDASCGRDIFLLRDIADLAYSQPYLIQKYIENPLTIGGYKLDFRIYVLVTSLAPLQAYVYRNGLVRFGTSKYDPNGDLSDLYSHLTNSSINKSSPSCAYSKDGVGAGCKWDLGEFEDWCKEEGHSFEHIFGRMKSVINLTLVTLTDADMSHPNCFELFGFDIMLDHGLKPWILEVNSSPSMGLDFEVDRRVKIPLIRDSINLIDWRPQSKAKAVLPAPARPGGGSTTCHAPPVPKRLSMGSNREKISSSGLILRKSGRRSRPAKSDEKISKSSLHPHMQSDRDASAKEKALDLKGAIEHVQASSLSRWHGELTQTGYQHLFPFDKDSAELSTSLLNCDRRSPQFQQNVRKIVAKIVSSPIRT